MIGADCCTSTRQNATESLTTTSLHGVFQHDAPSVRLVALATPTLAAAVAVVAAALATTAVATTAAAGLETRA
eukprot:CAMPEP_0113838288 /NCGR_PEP_ID=MMETSP0328-20130328/10461_1 /TAXON_ID=39455 /ORGANISM="Alexandrium minutum" /LENGTH=72 /DNA_ID=CAMNT_0000806815 /DNA_START=36 /DNA_END=254 /DNA_ORIENTATION=- /assembly_acc=CAM_ASM_000350